MKSSQLFTSISNLHHGFTTKLDSASIQDSIRLSTASVKQVHKDKFHWVMKWEKAAAEADSIGTQTPDLTIGVYTADCAPILLAAIDTNNRAIAVSAIHAGWRGTALEISSKALEEFWRINAHRSVRILATVGPTISRKAFEVGSEVVDAFPGAEANGIACFLRMEGEKKKFHFDLPGENARQLKDTAQRLQVSLQLDVLPECTFFAADIYHSYRRDRELAGRNLSFISFSA